MAMFSDDVLINAQGTRLTRALFKEVAQEGDKPVFTLSRNDSEGYINIRNIFIDLVAEDPTEYVFAEAVFGDFAHWDKIANSTWMKEPLKEWRQVADVKRKELAFKVIIQEAKGGKSSSFAAAKYLIDEPWKDKRSPVKRKASKDSTSKASAAVSQDLQSLKDKGLI